MHKLVYMATHTHTHKQTKCASVIISHSQFRINRGCGCRLSTAHLMQTHSKISFVTLQVGLKPADIQVKCLNGETLILPHILLVCLARLIFLKITDGNIC